MQIRSINSEKEIEQVQDLWDYCFEKRDTAFFQWYFSTYCPKQNEVLGAFVNGDLAGMLHLNPYTISLNNQHIDTSYIVGVATSPLHRRKGVLKSLLLEAFSSMKQKGQSVAILMPSAIGVYLPYGFAFCYQQLRYEVPVLDLLDTFFHKKDIDFVLLQPTDFLVLLKIYNEFTDHFNGNVVRQKVNWDNILGELHAEGGYIVAAKKNDEYLGYMLYILEDNTFKIVELVCLDEEVKKAFLSYASQHFSQCEKVFWQTPINDLTYLLFTTNRHYPKIWPFMAVRIIDPIKVLDDIDITMVTDITINIEITDSLLKENNAVFQLESKNRKASIKKVTKLPNLKMDIGTLAQVYFSAYSIDELYNSGKIEVFTEGSLNVLQDMFKTKTNFVNEYF